MAGASLLVLLDDITALLDDIATMSKVAAQKTAGVLGDDLALNAEQVSGLKADRELPIIWAVAKGSFLNKLILVPSALTISAFIPWLIMPLLMIGGAFLCYEGFEKIWHSFRHPKPKRHLKKQQKPMSAQDIQALERRRIKGAIRTDLILSAEIIVIALGTVKEESMLIQTAVVSLLAITITVIVYGLVAAIVRMDDVGLYLLNNPTESFKKTKQVLGKAIIYSAPQLLRFLTIVGTAAMFLVGGGILVHGISTVHHAIEHAADVTAIYVSINIIESITSALLNGVFGFVAGAVIYAVLTLKTVFNKKASAVK